MPITDGQSRTPFDELKPGDRIEVDQQAAEGAESRITTTVGTVIRTERHKPGTRLQCNRDDEVCIEEILVELPDGELTTVAVDRHTVIRRA